MHALLLLHMLGCGGGHAAEREAYLAAVTGPIEEADEQCRHVEGTLGDDCRLLVAERRIEAGVADSVESAQLHDAPAFADLGRQAAGGAVAVLGAGRGRRAREAAHLGDGPRGACGRRADGQAQ